MELENCNFWILVSKEKKVVLKMLFFLNFQTSLSFSNMLFCNKLFAILNRTKVFEQKYSFGLCSGIVLMISNAQLVRTYKFSKCHGKQYIVIERHMPIFQTGHIILAIWLFFKPDIILPQGKEAYHRGVAANDAQHIVRNNYLVSGWIPFLMTEFS